MTDIGELVRAYRVFAGLTQIELAEDVGKSDTTISRIEHGTPVRSSTLEKVLRRMSIPVFCLSVSVDYSRLIEIKRDMLKALYFGDREWYFELYYKYIEHRELDGVLGEMYAAYFKLMRTFFMDGWKDRLLDGFMSILQKSAPVLSIFEEICEYKGDLSHGMAQKVAFSKGVLRREIKRHCSEIELLLINGLAITLFYKEDYLGAQTIFEELIYFSREKEKTFNEEKSIVPTLCYNLALCLFKDGKYQKACDVISYARTKYRLTENPELKMKYRELLDISLSLYKRFDKLEPIFTFPNPVYYYIVVSDLKNMKEFYKKL